MKSILTKKFNSDHMALEYYDMVSDITSSVSALKVYSDGFTVRVVGDADKIKELEKILNS